MERENKKNLQKEIDELKELTDNPQFLKSLEAAEDCLGIPQTHVTIRIIIQTVRRLIRQNNQNKV